MKQTVLLFLLLCQLSVNCQPDPLPVTWEYIRVEKNDEGAFLEFSVASQTDNKTFEAQCLGDRWATFETMPGDGTTSETIIHKVMVKLRPGQNYFRVKQTDFDGQHSYSDIVSLDGGVPEPKWIYANGEINFVEDVTAIRLFNMNGSVGKTMVDGKSVEVSQNPPGMYFFKADAGNIGLCGKITIQ